MKPLFFVTNVARCGSQWLARLLDTAPDIKCYHLNYLVKNVVGGDIQFMIDTWHGKDPHPYLRESRERVAQFAEKEALGMRGWGEVNKFIRYCVPAVREVFGAPVAGLIRNGHLTIPSLLRHYFYRPNRDWDWTSAIEMVTGKHYRQLSSPVLSSVWSGMTPFARCCWLWADSYQRLLDQDVPIFTLESLNAEFGNVERLCDVLGISVSHEDWQERAGKPIDDFYKGRRRPTTLPPDQLETFNRWAGDVQEYFYGS